MCKNYAWLITNSFLSFICIPFLALGHGKVGKLTYLEKHLPSLPNLGDRQDAFDVYFEWDESFGIPGAFYIKNYMQSEFFLVSFKLEDVPNHGTILFACNSWVYNAKLYKKDRIFFANKVTNFLPSKQRVTFRYYYS